jgi:hypothetical protein
MCIPHQIERRRTMTATPYSLTDNWSATNRYTAGANIDVCLSNPLSDADHIIAWTTTTSDTAPTITVSQGNKIRPLDGRAMSLISGDRLWMAVHHRTAGSATLEV